MATGITKKRWKEETQIVSDELFEGDFSYELNYRGKTPENLLLKAQPENTYKLLLERESENDLYFGDNIDVLKHLIHQKNLSGTVKLVYIDPPYGTNSIFQTRHQKNSYKDDLVGGHFIEFLRRRLILLKKLISEDGAIYIHLDGNMTFQVKVIMDEIFDARNFRGFITRKKCSNKNFTRKTYGNISDYILFYSKTDKFTWHRPTVSWSEEKMLKEYPCIDEKTGRRYKKVPIHAPGIRNGETGKEWRGMMPPKGKHWQYIPEKLDELDANGEIYWSSNGNPRRKVFFDKDKGIPVQDIWLDVQDSLNQNIKITGYPTEKNPLLLERIIKASSEVGDLVLDCFAGSGTTLDLANQLNRRWIGIDNSSEAIKSIFSRFYNGLEEMGDFVKKQNRGVKIQNDQYWLDLTDKNKFNFYSDYRFVENISESVQTYLVES